MKKITLKLQQEAYPTGDYKTYEASAIDINNTDSDDDSVYMVYWDRKPDDEISHLDDESEYCDWDKVSMIKLNGREQDIENFEIVR